MNISINGYGALCAAGPDPDAMVAAYRSGRSTWTVDPATGLPVYRIGALPDHPRIAAFTAARTCDRAALLALHAADQAITKAGWEGGDFAVLLGCSRGPTSSWEDSFRAYAAGAELPPRTSPRTTLGSLAFAVAEYFGSSGPSTGLSVTCSSGLHALYHGVALLRAGLAERVLVGGTEAPLTGFTLRQLQALRIYAKPTTGDQPPCRPFANPATGMAVGEGAAFLALSRANTAWSGPRLLAVAATRERAGTATGISREGRGLQVAMRAVTEEGGVPKTIVAHAPGTQRGDAAELSAITAVFGPEPPPTISYKCSTGHTFGASGPLALTAALADVQLAGPVLINATGFGGNVVSVLVNRG